MHEEHKATEVIKKPETQEALEGSQSVESPEELRQQMLDEAEKEITSFKKEGDGHLVQVEARAEKDGLAIDGDDKEALQILDKEAEVAKAELEAEIAPTKSQPEKANIVGVTRDRNFEGSVIVKTEDKEGRITGYALRKNRRGDWEGNEIRYMKDGSIGPVYQLHEADFSKLGEQGILESYEDMPAMKERTIENPELLSEKEASKKFLAEERRKIAQEILEQRKAQRERLSIFKTNIREANNPAESMEGELEDKQYAQLAERQSTEADEIAERLSSTELSEQDASDERENIGQLIDSSDGVSSLRKRLEEHYAKADEIAQKKFESVRKTVEQTLIRNNAFIVHTFVPDERLRHNANSNISERATIEDDMDILLSLEPSISTSSVVPGSRQGLWNEDIGVIIGGGDIRGGVQTDNQTQVGGIKERNGTISSSEEIDKIVSDKSERGYNELVVNNPKVFGFFKNVNFNEDGKMIGFSDSLSVSKNKEQKDDFMRYLDVATQKGMPSLVMTPDRRLFEFMGIANNGVISIGAEITPEQVALGNAGLSNKKRKEIGEDVISKNLFREISHQKEAKGIITELSGQENAEVDLSREEYLAYAKDNPGKISGFPNKLLEDKDFMIEAAQFDPASTYKFSGENLKRDVDFIKRLYSLEKKNNSDSLYISMPDELKKNEKIAEIAVENDDINGGLDFSLANSPVVWNKLIAKLVEKTDLHSLFEGEGNRRVKNVDLFMRDGKKQVNIKEKLLADQNFIQKLNDKFKNFKFEVDEYDELLVTKLSG
ncbi:MAG: hypothetical protein WC238_01435 [Parcubacteria group bacterium]|jgi:hypothetical protein